MPKLEIIRSPKRECRANTSFNMSARAPKVVQRIDRMLRTRVLDLFGIRRELLSEPGLALMTSRIADSLALEPGGKAPTLEEQIALLGQHRLRVILNAWCLLQRKGQAMRSAGVSERSVHETAYLASFLRYLGLDSPDAARLHGEMFALVLDPCRADFSDLRQLLMRDFLALLPLLDPRVTSKPRSL